MICPYMVNISLLIGAVLSWGIMWPLIETKKGIWYGADLSPSSLHGIQGYRVIHPSVKSIHHLQTKFLLKPIKICIFILRKILKYCGRL